MAVAAQRKWFVTPAVAGTLACAFAAVASVVFVRVGAAEALAIIALPVLACAALHSLWVTYACVVAVVCLAPFATLPLSGPATPTLLEISLLCAFALQSTVLLLDRRQQLKVGAPQVIWVVLVGVTAFAFVLGLGRGYTSDTAHTYFAFVLSLCCFWLTIQIVNNISDARRVILLLLAGVTSAAGIALVLYAGGASLTERVLLHLVPYGYPGSRIARFIEDDPSRPLRAVGTSVDPNSFGGLLMVGFVIAVAGSLARLRIAPRWAAYGAVVLIGLALLLTYSRGAWIGAFGGGAIVVAYRRPRWLLPIVLLGALAVAIGLGRGFVERLWLGFTLQDPATKLRIDEYRNAWAIIQRHPWFGVGFGDAPTINLQTGVSSVFLTIAERSGILGLAAFLVLVGVVLWRSLPIFSAPGAIGDCALALGSAFVAALIAGLVDHYFFNPLFAHMSALFCIIAGVLVSLQYVFQRDVPPFQSRRSAVRSSTANGLTRQDHGVNAKGIDNAGPSA